MMKEMPCGPGVVTPRNNPEAAALILPHLLYTKEWFGFTEVDIEVPEDLWPEFQEFPPLFVNRGVPDSAVPKHMHDYLRHSGRTCFPEQLKLLGVFSAKKILLYAPLLEWYLNRGLKLTAVYRTIDYEPREIFSWFVKEMADNRRKGDADKDKVLLAEVFKLLGNSAYGKFIEAVERQNRTLYTRDEEEVDKHLRSAWFKDLEEIGDAYKIELRKDKIDITRPFQVGIVVYQLAKLRMLQFYYEFLDFYFDRRDFELIQMDTDSTYFGFFREKLEDAVRPGYEAQFEEDKRLWLAWDKWSNREPGLFKLEKQATFSIALCSKCFYMEDRATGQAKVSSRGSTSARTRCAPSVSSEPSKAARKPLCGFTTSVNEIPTHTLVLTREQLEALQHMSNEQLAATILSPVARSSAPREQTRASAHRAGSTPRVFPVS